MQLWKNIISLLVCGVLAACVRAPDALSVHSASIDADVLSAQFTWQPDTEVLDALDHGIALDFSITLQAQAGAMLGWRRTLRTQHCHLQLRYYPLTRQYQLRDLERGQTRSYAARALALAALENVRLPLPDWYTPDAQRYRLWIELDRSTLPGALRLPALLRPAWHVSSGDYVWSAHAG